MDIGEHQHLGTSSDSEGSAVIRPPTKRVKSKSRVWDRVSWFSRKSRTTREGHIELALTGEEEGAAALPDQMEVDDMPSSSSGPSPRPLSDCSSSSEGDLSSLSLGTSCRNNHKKSSSSKYSNSEVVYQNCVKPSLVKAMFGKTDNVVCDTRLHVPRRTKKKKKSEQMYLSDDDEDEVAVPKYDEYSRNRLNDSAKLKNAWFGSKHVPCHCPACCSCRQSSESINFASWPRKRTCPLQMSLRLCRVDIPMAVKQSPSMSTKDTKKGSACSKASWCPSGDITMSNLSLHADQPWAVKKRVQGELQQARRRCCCPRRIEYGRKSLSLPAGSSLDSYSLDKLDTSSFSAIEQSEVEVMVTVDSASDHELPLQDEENCQSQRTKCNHNQTCNHHGEGDGDHQQQTSLPWNKGVDGSVFKQRMEVISQWFGEFNDQQKNVMMKRLLEQCDLPQMHMLSVTMEPILHQSCPHNCQDLVSWLPTQLSLRILSYLDPVSLCRCASVSRAWYELANEPTLWRTLCRLPKWRLTQAEEQKQMINHMSSDIHWKLVFAERYRLRHNWLKGLCTVRTFEGHTQGISCVQFDDTRIVSGSSDKSIKVWNIRTNSPWSVQTLVGHSGTVRCLHLEGNRLVSGSTDRTIKVWDLSMQNSWSSIACKVTMTGHQDTVRCLQVDYEKVVSGSYDRTLKVWDIRTGRCKVTLRGHTGAVLCLQFDSSKIVSGSADKTIKIWSLDSGTCLSTLTGHQDAVTCLQFDANKIISGSLDSNLKFWDLHTGQCTSTIDWAHSEGHTGVIRCLQADVWRVVSAADDRTLKVWNIETGERLVTLRHHRDGVTCLQFNNSKIVSGSYDKTVKLWDFSTV